MNKLGLVYGVYTNIDSEHLSELVLYKRPTSQSLDIYPEVVVTRNSLLAWNLDPHNLIGNPGLSDVTSSLFYGIPESFLSYAREYNETGELIVPDNYIESLCEFLKSNQLVNSSVMEYMKPYVSALSLLPNHGVRKNLTIAEQSVNAGYNGDPIIMKPEYLLGAIMIGNAETVSKYLSDIEPTSNAFWLLPFGNTEFLRELLSLSEGSANFSIIQEVMVYLPDNIFYDLYEDIISVSGASSIIAAKALIQGELFKLWLLQSTVKELDANVLNNYPTKSFVPSPLMIKYYEETLRS